MTGESAAFLLAEGDLLLKPWSRFVHETATRLEAHLTEGDPWPFSFGFWILIAWFSGRLDRSAPLVASVVQWHVSRLEPWVRSLCSYEYLERTRHDNSTRYVARFRNAHKIRCYHRHPQRHRCI